MIGIPALCDSLVKWGLVALLVFTPLAFGSVEPWSIALMEWGIVALFLVFALGRLWGGANRMARQQRARGIQVALGAFLVFCALQTLPLPLSWLKVVSPGSAQMYGSVDLANWKASSDLATNVDEHAVSLLPLTIDGRRPVSVQPRTTWDRIQMLAVLGLLFVLVAGWADRADRVVFLLGVVATVGFLVAVQGLVQHLTWNGKILWFRKVPPSDPFGPFVNHNHFAGYVEMIIPVAISLTLFLVEIHRHGGTQRAVPSGRGDLEVRGPADSDDGGRLGKAALSLFAAVILVVGLFLSLSWGGILSTALSGLIFFVLVGRRLVSRRLAWTVASVIPPLVLGLVIWVGADEIKHQVAASGTAAKEASLGLRLMIWDSLLRNIRPYLWAGAGLGCFEASFAQFTPPGSTKAWDRAHNDYLQFLWETGVCGLILMAIIVWIFVRRYWWPAIRSRGHALDLFRVGVAVSLLCIALHSAVDFNLQIGANGFLFAFLVGTLVSLHHCVEEDRARRPVLVEPSRDTS